MIEEALIKELTQVPTTKSSGTKANMSNQMQQIAASQPTGRWTSGTNLQHDEKIRQKGNVGGGSRNIQKKQQNRYTRNRRELSFSKSTKKIEASFSGEGERKQGGECLNSLLNFHYSSSTKSSFYKTSHSIQSHKHKRTNTFNKEVFLQANCHFVVDDHIEYPESIADPDVLVDWQLIRLVYLPTHEPTTCPICLSPPWAAKITRCGHLYCWSCILHYLQLDNKSWRKCPICHEAVHQKDLKSVCTIQRKRFARHDNITMKLMKKEKGSLFTSPACSKQSNTALPQWRGDSLLQFKLMLADQDLVINKILLREKNELEVQLQEALADNTGEACFIESAMLEIEKQIGELKNIDSDLKQALCAGKDIEQTNIKEEKYDATSVAAMLSHTNISKRVEFSDEEDDLKSAAMFATPPAELCGQMDGKDSPEEDQDFRPDKGIENMHFERENMNKTVDAVDNSDLFYYYYQAEDGQNIFIDSLNARCLIEEYGALCFGPEMITGQILDFESYTMTKELRKRFRYLSHLPLSCEFVICELLLRPPALSKHTIHNFMPEFRKRRATRARKTEEQRRFDRKAQNIINKDLGFRVTEYDSNEEQIDLTDMTDFPASFSPPNNTNTAENEQQSGSGRSFAQMLKEKQAEAFPPMPAATPKKQSNTSWGPTVLHKSTLAEMKLQAKNADQNDDEEVVAAPSFKSTFNAALFPMASVTNEVTSPPNNKQNKKKNKKGMVLFSTGAAQRRY